MTIRGLLKPVYFWAIGLFLASAGLSLLVGTDSALHGALRTLSNYSMGAVAGIGLAQWHLMNRLGEEDPRLKPTELNLDSDSYGQS